MKTSSGKTAFRVVAAPDSFKGSLSSLDAAKAIERGVMRAVPDADVAIVPMADGGEGTVDALLAAVGGELRRLSVTGPLGEPVEAAYGMLADGRTAVIEVASASGLPLVPPDRKNPLAATSFGTGQLIADALNSGASRLLIGLGGSATNDGGMGMAQALGIRFIDAAGAVMTEHGCGGMLKRIADVDLSGLDPGFSSAEVIVLSDVTNPLCGPNGASAVYGPQKGATAEMVELLDQGLAHYAERIAVRTGRLVGDIPGSGAAGGIGASLLAFGQAELKPGIRVVMELAGLEGLLRNASLVITGEGRTDRQTAYGKVPAGIAQAANAMGAPVLCLSGGLGEGIAELYEKGITALFSIANRPMTLDEAMRETDTLLAEAAENAVRLFRGGIGAR